MSTTKAAATIAKSKLLLLLPSFIQTNKRILQQKQSLIQLLQTKYGPEQTLVFYTLKCPLVQASIGQHYRHSMDHIELAALVAATTNSTRTSIHSTNMEDSEEEIRTLRYDLRVRGGTLEKDVNESLKRIQSVMTIFDEIQQKNDHDYDHHHHQQQQQQQQQPIDFLVNKQVNASFMLTSSSSSGNNNNIDNDYDMELSSTIGRELGFCAHHAIHHMAMVKIIALQTIGLEEHELPFDFGKAPSTVQHEINQ